MEPLRDGGTRPVFGNSYVQSKLQVSLLRRTTSLEMTPLSWY